jgi:hypothetical protein
MVKELLEERRAELRGQITDRLRAISVQSVENAAYGDEMLANCAFWVEKSRADEFGLELERLRAELGMVEIRVTRKCVPYNFIKVVIDLE